ncbi:MAG: DNA recombination protein RmuC [Acidobacteria bacterium]|nr:DNA recombination protein RmuC [Acidobacteriota bacterium]
MTELLVVVILLQVGILVVLVSRKSGSGEVLEEFSRFRREVNEIAAGMRSDLDSKMEQVQRRSGDLVDEFSQFRREASEMTTGMRKELDGKLELMRATVDEKLQTTLEKRLSESFKQVSERLEQVHQGLGEMQTLAVGVGDLKKVLGNVKTRGTWGEVQLGALLDQVLTPDQYGKNVAVTGTTERVEFAVKLPGHETTVWLPIDAKFPMEDYQRLVEASEVGDAAGVAKAIDELEKRVKVFAKSIRDKYIAPPMTTDFGILFLPTEGLYAEMMRRTLFVDEVQRELRVTLAGPSTLLALLNSLQMGFRTLEIQKRSSEVWELLGVVKGEFLKYHAVLGKVREKLDSAAKTIDDAEQRTRVIQRRLKGVEEKALGAGETRDTFEEI